MTAPRRPGPHRRGAHNGFRPIDTQRTGREVELEAPGETVVGVERSVARDLLVQDVKVDLGLGHLPKTPVAPAISTRPSPGIRPCVTSAYQFGGSVISNLSETPRT